MPRRRPLNPVPDQPGRVLLYVRVSALMGRGGEDFHSPDLQIESMRRAASMAGLREVGIIRDIDVSGRGFSREGLDKLKAMVEARQVDVVALYDLARLGRNTLQSLTFIQWLRDHGVTVMSSRERIDDTPEGQFMLGQYLSIAQLYSDQLGQRWKQVIEYRAKQGFAAGPPPMGYQLPLDDAGKRIKGLPIEPDPVLAPVVAAAFRRYAAGDKISDITATVAAARGKPTSAQMVKSMLANPVYLGRVALWGRDPKKGRRWITVHDVPVYLGPGKHEPLVDEATFKACRERALRDSVTHPRHLAVSHPLVGLLYCAHCGYHLQKWTNRTNKRDVDERGEPVVRYHCRRVKGGQHQGVQCPGVGTPAAADVEAAVLGELRRKLSRLRGDNAERAADMARRAREKTDAELLIRERDEVRRQLDTVIRKAVATTSAAAAETYQRLQADLEAQDASLTERLARIEPSPAGHELTFETFSSLGEGLLRVWPDATIDERNRLLRAVVRRVEVRHADRWREPVADRVRVEFR